MAISGNVKASLRQNSLQHQKLTRAEKSEHAREALFSAAAQVVGEFGYRDASITRIVERAGLATGTFYYYFQSRQDLFDELLPAIGCDMLDFIRIAAGGSGTYIEKEERSFRAFFRFLASVPHFTRILNEAEVFAPVAHSQHLRIVSDQYVRFLQKYRSLGEISNLDDSHLEPIVYMLIAARTYLAVRYSESAGDPVIINNAVEGYLQILQGALCPSMKYSDDQVLGQS